MYATYLWQESSEDDRTDSLMMLQEYVGSVSVYKEQIDIEIAGMFLTYWSNKFLSDWQEQKDLRFSQSPKQFAQRRSRLVDEGHKIYALSQKVFQFARTTSLSKLSPGARQNLSSGFYRVVDVLFRLHKYNEAIEYCDHFMNEPSNVSFANKRRWILSFKNKPRPLPPQ